MLNTMVRAGSLGLPSVGGGRSVQSPTIKNEVSCGLAHADVEFLSNWNCHFRLVGFEPTSQVSFGASTTICYSRV